MPLEIHPLTPDRWLDFEKLFREKRGEVTADESLAGGGCWCMEWRLPPHEYLENVGEGNRCAMKALVDAGEVPGVLAYALGGPVGWCSIGPRHRFAALDYRQGLGRIDEEEVWSVVCFFVAEDFRRQGMTHELLRGALAYARSQGAEIVEAYPVDGEMPVPGGAEGYRGLISTLEKAGFVEAARNKGREPIYRHTFG